jgi:hypothetical protein
MPGIPPQARNKADALTILLFFFALLFAPIPFFLYFHPLLEAQRQHRVNQTYLPVDARIVSSTVATHRGSKGSVYYVPEITYAYVVDDTNYQSSRLRAIYVSGDDQWANDIVSAYRPEKTYKAYYNPARPDEAVLIHTYSFAPYFAMLTATFCISGIVWVWLALWSYRQREPVPTDNGMFKLFPQFSVEQHLTIAQVCTAIWYGLGGLAAAHYLYCAPTPHASQSLQKLILFAVVGLIPVGVTLGYYRVTRNLGAPLLLLNRPAAAVAQEFKFTISQQARRPIILTSVNVWLHCMSVKSKGRNHSERSQLYKEHPIALRNHPLRAGEALELSGALTIPQDSATTGRDESRAWIRWDITLQCKIKGGAVYETKFPLTVNSTPAEETPRPADLPSRARTQVQDIDAQPASRILTKGHVAFAYLIGMIPVYFLLIGFAALAVCFSTVFVDQNGKPPIVLPANDARVLEIAGGIIVLGCFVFALAFPNIGCVYFRRLAIRTIRQRPGAIVNPEATDALFVDVIPRSNWNRFMWENAADIGFLTVDLERREIRFEGDRQRYRIPAESMSACTLEKSVAMQSAAASAPGNWLVVVRAYDANTAWEAPFAIRTPKGRTLRKSPTDASKELHARISSLLPKSAEKSIA